MEERAVLKRFPDIVKTVCYSRDGKWLAACGGGVVRVWDAATLKEVAKLDGYRFGVADIAFSPDGKRLATTGFQEPSRLYDTATWKLRAKLPGNPEGTRGIAFSPDCKTLALTEFSGLVRLWDPATGKELGITLQLGVPHLGRIAFWPDGKTLAGAGEGKVVLFDLATKKVRATLGDYKGPVWTMACSPDGKALLTAGLGLDERALLWDAASGKQLHRLDLTKRMVWAWAGAFSPDCKTVALVGESPDVHLYDVATGREQAVLKSARTAYHCVTFSPDGRTLVTGCGNGTLKLFDVPKGK
jgi:WD40 repeat protein